MCEGPANSGLASHFVHRGYWQLKHFQRSLKMPNVLQVLFELEHILSSLILNIIGILHKLCEFLSAQSKTRQAQSSNARRAQHEITIGGIAMKVFANTVVEAPSIGGYALHNQIRWQ